MSKIEFGWPFHKRIELIKELEASTASKRFDAQILFLEKTLLLPVFRIPLTFPKYRLSNEEPLLYNLNG